MYWRHSHLGMERLVVVVVGDVVGVGRGVGDSTRMGWDGGVGVMYWRHLPLTRRWCW